MYSPSDEAFFIGSIPEGGYKRSKVITITHFGGKALPLWIYDSKCEILSISQCENITEIPDNISRMKHLRVLTVNGLKNLVTIPDSIFDIPTLTVVSFTSCPKAVEPKMLEIGGYPRTLHVPERLRRNGKRMVWKFGSNLNSSNKDGVLIDSSHVEQHSTIREMEKFALLSCAGVPNELVLIAYDMSV